MSPSTGYHAENCQPPLTNSPELIEYLRGLKEGERVVECGSSGTTGCLGTVTIREHAGKPSVCVIWDSRGDHKGQMTTSVTGGARRLKDGGTFSHLDDERGPDCSDGCSLTGQPNATCSKFQMGDTIMFAEHHISAGDYGVIVGLERWLNDNEAVPWDGVGRAPVYVGALGSWPSSRYLVRIESHSPNTKDRTIGGLAHWRARCLQWPHSYPYVLADDMQLVSRPNFARNSDYPGSVIGMDVRQSLSCSSDSEAGARKAMADMKAALCLPLRKEPV